MITSIYSHIKSNWKFYSVIFVLLFVCYKLFFHFYTLRAPYVLKTEVSQYVNALNDDAICNQQLNQAIDDKHAAIEANNPDLFK